MENIDVRFLTFLLEAELDEVRNELLSHPLVYDKGEGWILLYNPDASKDICLVSHYDTVWDIQPRRKVMREGSVLKSAIPFLGIGADDRAGVYACLKLAPFVKWVLFCDGEEEGGIGAYSFTKARPKLTDDFSPKLFIELDRKGTNDAVFYDECSQDFMDWVLSFGWNKAHGSFSDISILTPHYEKPSVNLSVGYEAQHTPNESLYLTVLSSTISRVKGMIEDFDNRTFSFKLEEPDFDWYRGYYGFLDYPSAYDRKPKEKKPIHSITPVMTITISLGGSVIYENEVESDDIVSALLQLGFTNWDSTIDFGDHGFIYFDDDIKLSGEFRISFY